jgi:hypothetical protein
MGSDEPPALAMECGGNAAALKFVRRKPQL